VTAAGEVMGEDLQAVHVLTTVKLGEGAGRHLDGRADARNEGHPEQRERDAMGHAGRVRGPGSVGERLLGALADRKNKPGFGVMTE